MSKYAERQKFIKQIIFWSVVAGGIIALFIPVLSTGSIPVMAEDCMSRMEIPCLNRCGNDTDCIYNCMIEACPQGSTTPIPGANPGVALNPCAVGPCIGGTGNNTGVSGLINTIFGLINTAVYVGTAVAVLMMAITGAQWAIQGDANAKKNFRNIVLGTAALVGVYLIIALVDSAVRFFASFF